MYVVEFRGPTDRIMVTSRPLRSFQITGKLRQTIVYCCDRNMPDVAFELRDSSGMIEERWPPNLSALRRSGHPWGATVMESKLRNEWCAGKEEGTIDDSPVIQCLGEGQEAVRGNRKQRAQAREGKWLDNKGIRNRDFSSVMGHDCLKRKPPLSSEQCSRYMVRWGSRMNRSEVSSVVLMFRIYVLDGTRFYRLGPTWYRYCIPRSKHSYNRLEC